MNTAKARKLQYLLISELLKTGSVELILPDGITLEIGILQENELGDLKKTDDYCYVVATRDGKSAMLDSYNLGLQYEPEKNTIVYEDELIDKDGVVVRTLDVV
jgi:hypothetical protein